MKTVITKTRLLLFVLFIVVQACSALPGIDDEPSTGQPDAGISIQSPEDEPVNLNIPTPRRDVVPVDLPQEVSGHAGDQASSTRVAVSGGDRFTFGQFERPFNSEAMDVYYPSLDIVDTFVYQDETWIYGVIQLGNRESSDSITEKYALELDTDRDGRGDWLVLASNPASSDWTVSGVQIFSDMNDDVGSSSAMFTDENAVGNGFETLVFDQGVGADPESAWVRTSPANGSAIEISVKRAVLETPRSFMINMWAGTSLLDPELFDLNDYFTHEEAGAADPGFELFYPIKKVAEIDNSCRLAVGFQPIGNEPGLCKNLIPVEPSGPSAPSSPSTSNQSCKPCPEGASSQEPYPDCRCTFPIFQ